MSEYEKGASPKVSPIIFSPPMIDALLEGRKSQTRRVMKVQPPEDSYKIATMACTTGSRKNVGRQHWVKLSPCGYRIVDDRQPFFSCPYGKPGDLLWVRETWTEGQDGTDCGSHRWPIYAAEYRDGSGAYKTLKPWNSSLFMPRKYSRLTLEITEVRVQRLQDISEDDAKSEGATSRQNDYIIGWRMDWNAVGKYSGFERRQLTEYDLSLASPRFAFANYINELHDGQNWFLKPCSLWNKNPWVWAISFRVHRQNIDAVLAAREAA